MLIEERGVKHYCLVKSINRLLSSQVTNGKRKEHFCLRCLNPFWCQEALDKHKEYGNEYEAVRIELPKKGTMLEFKNYHRSEKVPFTIYADFECYIKPMQSCEPNPESSYTKQYQKHEPSSFCYYIKCFDDEIYGPELVSYMGEDAAQKFVEMLERDIREITSIPEKKMIFGKEEKERFDKETKCWICNGEFDGDVKIRDHCHFTGSYRDAAHNSCNLKYRKPNFTSVVFHNLSGYDSHLFVKNLGFSDGSIDCIPNNEERYISFTKKIQVGSYPKKGENKPLHHQIRFIDSFKFMNESLEKLVNNLSKEAFNNVKRYYAEDKLELLTRKGIYPYEYMNSPEKLKETQLPPKEAFYSRLNDEGIGDENYAHVRKVWETFEMKSLEDYHNLYNRVDILLLKDMDMLLIVEKGIRGGVSVISNRYGKSNNRYMGDSFDVNKPSKYIAYLDANNLYGWAMSKPLPTHGFKWMKVSRLETWGNHSCILEADLEYPKSHHNLHSDYPLAPEQIEVNKIKILVPNLGDKKKYILHYENLKQYLSLGLKLTHIHRGIKFKKSQWLEKYIVLNTELRTAAINEFEKDFFKLMNNSVFGKTMENIRNRVDI